MHICVSKLSIIGSDDGLSPGQRQAIIWMNADILFIGPLETSCSEILIDFFLFSFKNMHLNTSPDSKVDGTNMVLSTPGGPHVGPTNLTIWGRQNIGSHFVFVAMLCISFGTFNNICYSC